MHRQNGQFLVCGTLRTATWPNNRKIREQADNAVNDLELPFINPIQTLIISLNMKDINTHFNDIIRSMASLTATISTERVSS
jgi:hypothetical protein